MNVSTQVPIVAPQVAGGYHARVRSPHTIAASVRASRARRGATTDPVGDGWWEVVDNLKLAGQVCPDCEWSWNEGHGVGHRALRNRLGA